MCEDREWIECHYCGDRIESGSHCYKISGEFLCDACGKDELEYRYGTYVDSWDCHEFQENVDEQWKEWSAETKEELNW